MSVVEFADDGVVVGDARYDSLMCSNAGVEGGDAVTAELAVMLARLGVLAGGDTTADAAVSDAAVSDAVRIDRIALLERMRSAVAAAQYTETRPVRPVAGRRADR